MAYKLLALDLDGTVIGRDLVIADAVRDGIANLQQRGVHVTLATGRLYSATIPFARYLGISAPVICYQGALLRHPQTDEVFAHIVMPSAPAAEVTTELLERDIFCVAYINEKHYIAGRRAELDLYLSYHPEGAEIVVVPDLPAVVAANPPTKILFVGQNELIGSTLADLGPRYAGRLDTIRSHEYFGEITAVGVSKGAMLAILAERLGVTREEVVAIGDQENDLSMIRWAGLGLAMGNAIPAVQAAAAAVLPSVQEAGVAYAIARYF
jgi:Cof subfamily protein (haloacid dehalogenase superfamily)